MNRDVAYTLDEAVAEVLTITTGLALQYNPDSERYIVITRLLNRAMRQVALEHEWSYYSSTENVGVTSAGMQTVELTNKVRPRIVNDDAVRLAKKGAPVVWAYILPRDAIHKYRYRRGLWCEVTRSTLAFSRPLHRGEAGLDILVPVMREPKQFELPDPGEEIPDRIRKQQIDFDFPDLVIARAVFLFAQSDPVLQPRVQTLEAEYKDQMYQLIDRDKRHTDSPYQNEFMVPMLGDMTTGGYSPMSHGHPHADERWY